MEQQPRGLDKMMTRREFLKWMAQKLATVAAVLSNPTNNATHLKSLLSKADRDSGARIARSAPNEFATSLIHSECPIEEVNPQKEKKGVEVRYGDLEIYDKSHKESPRIRTMGRYGGAIASIEVHSTETVDKGDSGRLGQTAFHDGKGQETFNGTQGGASPEYGGPTDTKDGTVQSEVLFAEISASGRTARVVTQPAYWKPLNTTHEYEELRKKAKIDNKLYFGTVEQWIEVNPTDADGKKHAGVIRIKSVANMPKIPTTDFATIAGGLALELPTIYTDAALKKMYWLSDGVAKEDATLNPANFPKDAYSAFQSNFNDPCISANDDGTVAIGQIRIPTHPPILSVDNVVRDEHNLFPYNYYSMYRYSRDDGNVGKMNIVLHQPNQGNGEEEIAKLMPKGDLKIEYETFIVTGTLAEVVERMNALQKNPKFGAWEDVVDQKGKEQHKAYIPFIQK
jgi:hypothetical protein